MQEIRLLLQKYSNLKSEESVVKESFNEAFDSVFPNIKVPEIKINKDSIIILSSGPLKSEFLIKKQSFNKEFEKKLKNIKFKRIN